MEGKPSFIAKINCEDLVLEQIVDDVDNMYRWESILLAIMSKNSTNILDIAILDIPVLILWWSTLKFSFFVPKSEQLKKQEDADDLNHNFKVIQKNLPIKKDGFASYLKQTTQEIADQIAKNLVDRALELDRKKLVKKLSKGDADNFKLQSVKSEMLDNFVEVAVNRYICEKLGVQSSLSGQSSLSSSLKSIFVIVKILVSY